MCDQSETSPSSGLRKLPLQEAVGTVLAHDITEIRAGEFKGPAFKKGHIIKNEDVCHLQRLGKEHLFVLNIKDDEMHEDDAAYALANALMGEGVAIKGAPKEGKISIIATRDGLLKINKDALFSFNMLGEVACSTLHGNVLVKKGQTIAGTRAIPLIVKKDIVKTAVSTGENAGGIISVREMRKPKAGVVITGREVYEGRIQDCFAPVIRRKIEELGGEIVGIYFAPDDREFIKQRLLELLDAGADLLITTGGMSVDPDDVTRFAIRELGAVDAVYGAPVLPGAMVLIGYLEKEADQKANGVSDFEKTTSTVPVMGIPACGMYHKTTIVDLLLPRLLAGEKIGRRELAELGHGGMCLHCNECSYPVCPFGK